MAETLKKNYGDGDDDEENRDEKISLFRCIPKKKKVYRLKVPTINLNCISNKKNPIYKTF